MKRFNLVLVCAILFPALSTAASAQPKFKLMPVKAADLPKFVLQELAAMESEIGQTIPVSAGKVDLDGDGREDLVVSLNADVVGQRDGSLVRIYLAQPNGTWKKVFDETVRPNSITLPGSRTGGLMDVKAVNILHPNGYMLTWNGEWYGASLTPHLLAVSNSGDKR